MKLQKLALTALALSMSAAFAAGTDKQAEGSSANHAPMAQSATANQPSSSTANQSATSSTDQAASSSTDQAATSSTGQASSDTGAAQSSSMSSEGATAQADPQVRQVQQALKDKGHDPGQIDGVMGPQTKQALQSFQQAQGISGAGELDQQTLTALDVQGDSTSSNTSSNQTSNASSSNQPSSATSSSMSSANPASSGNETSSSASQDSSSTKQGYTKQ